MREALQVDELRTSERMSEAPTPPPMENTAPKPTQNATPSNVTTANNGPINEDAAGPLLPQDSVQDFRTRWDHVQAAFVDEPRAAVQQADDLVKTAIQRLSESFTTARNNLEQQWDRGDEVNTEDLRVTFRKYRAFFQKILAI